MPPLFFRFSPSAQIEFRSSTFCPCSLHPQRRSSQPLSSSPPSDGGVSTPVRFLPPRSTPRHALLERLGILSEYALLEPRRLPNGLLAGNMEPFFNYASLRGADSAVQCLPIGIIYPGRSRSQTATVRCRSWLIQRCNSTTTRRIERFRRVVLNPTESGGS